MTNANEHQAVTSPIAAHVIAMLPERRLRHPLVRQNPASTGNAVIDIATPRNRANT